MLCFTIKEHFVLHSLLLQITHWENFCGYSLFSSLYGTHFSFSSFLKNNRGSWPFLGSNLSTSRLSANWYQSNRFRRPNSTSKFVGTQQIDQEIRCNPSELYPLIFISISIELSRNSSFLIVFDIFFSCYDCVSSSVLLCHSTNS